MVFSVVGRCRGRWKWIGRAQKLCLAAEITLKCLHYFIVITTSGTVLRSVDSKATDYKLSIFAAKAFKHDATMIYDTL